MGSAFARSPRTVAGAASFCCSSAALCPMAIVTIPQITVQRPERYRFILMALEYSTFDRLRGLGAFPLAELLDVERPCQYFGQRARLLFEHHRQRYREAAPLAQFAGERNIASQQFREFADNRQAQACAGVLAGERALAASGSRVALPELLENRLLIFERNSDSRILDDDLECLLVAQPGIEQHATPFRREFDGIRQQVVNDLLNFSGVLLEQRH